MSSYNRINGPFTQENGELLTTILRDEWGFDGIVMTDWTGLRNTAAQIKAGNDLMEPGNESQIKDLVEKVKSGALANPTRHLREGSCNTLSRHPVSGDTNSPTSQTLRLMPR